MIALEVIKLAQSQRMCECQSQELNLAEIFQGLADNYYTRQSKNDKRELIQCNISFTDEETNKQTKMNLRWLHNVP